MSYFLSSSSIHLNLSDALNIITITRCCVSFTTIITTRYFTWRKTA